MRATGVLPNVVSFSAAINVCGNVGEFERGLVQRELINLGLGLP